MAFLRKETRNLWKSIMNSGFFAKWNPQLEVSYAFSPPCSQGLLEVITIHNHCVQHHQMTSFPRKLQVSFAEYRRFYRSRLQKRPVILRSLLQHHLMILIPGVATISRLLNITGLFCKRDLEKRGYSAKETYHFKEPTHRSHPIVPMKSIICVTLCVCI